ncbi:zinc finger protein 37-like isoform X3 [Poecilia latipinna]|uniref:zinc finger protein 37-like isoform X3 n=1 Tax=Poecilia latipinna TaxID=48699 RepID=UPI00072DBF6A|nr:PREDICTED: zinc finger protein 37-like isoform X3 [Poecilia latipinna]
MFYCSSSGSDPLNMSKSGILRGIITEKLSTAAREIIAVVERTVADYEKEASGFRREIDRQRRQLELLQPQVKLHRGDVRDSGSLDFLWYGDDDHDEDIQPVVQVTPRSRPKREDLTDPDYEISPRSFPSRVRPEKRRASKPLSSLTHLDFRVRVLDNPETEVLSNNVFQKSPVQDLSCPRDLQESDFLDLLRSSIPQLAAGEPFDLFITDTSRKLHPLRVSSLTPEEIYRTIRSSGNSALYVRLKTAVKPQSSSSSSDVLHQLDEELSISSATPSSDQTEENLRLSSPVDRPQRRRRGRPRAGEEPAHHFLRVCVLEDNQSDAPTETGECKALLHGGEASPAEVVPVPELQTSSVQELKCPRRMQEAEFLDLLRLTFPQLVGDDKKINMYKSDRSRKLQKLKTNTLTPEEIYRSMRSTGTKKSVLYVKLKTGGGEESENEEQNLQLVKDEPQPTDCVVLEDETAPLQSPEDLDRTGSGHAAASDVGSGGENEALRDDDDEWEPNAEDLEEGDDPQPKRRSYKGPRRYMENGKESKVLCQVCGVWYRTVSGLTRHAWAHIGDPKSVCGVCGETFSSAEDMKVHFEVHQKIHDCSYCGKGFFTASGLKNHVSLHTGERQFKCSHCSKTFAVQSALNVHLWVHVEDRPHKCDLCPKTFGLRGQLTAHKKSHVSRDRYLCNICGRSVGDLRSLTRHKLTHSNERHYGCKVCGKRFKLEHTLKEHMKVHTTRDRMFLCHICCKTFLSNNALMGHMKTHSGERPFVCVVCSKSFFNKYDLQKHMRVHTGETPYGCSHCGRHFKLKSTLNVHIQSHLGIKRFSCGVCGKACSRQEHLNVHMRTHNGERPYRCSLCDKAFTQSHCLKTHMKSYHPEHVLFQEPSTSFIQPLVTEGTTELTTDGTTELTTDGTTELTTDGTTDGATEGSTELMTDRTTEGL